MNTFDLTKRYDRNTFTPFLSDFLPEEYKPTGKDIYYPESSNIEEGYELGYCEPLGLSVLEFTTKVKRDPRISLTKEVCKWMDKNSHYPNALVVLHTKKSDNWRFSLITTEYKPVKNKTKGEHSNPKRLSFKFGEGCKEHTPKQMLFAKGEITDFKDLKSRFDIEVVTKEFYEELFNWYSWACKLSTYPIGKGRFVKQTNINNETNLIRLITRLMFVWFIKQKELVPNWIFDENELSKILTDFDSQSTKKGNYYNAIIQNLFFATLNKAILERKFTNDDKAYKQYGIKTLYRDDIKKSYFNISHEKIVNLFRPVPFLNGGLFECLDKLESDENGNNLQVYNDGFSRESDRRAFLPNALFFQKAKDGHEGLIHILNRYNFTVEENSPVEVQVALDPELLGKVFENLLGTYNPETSETARKSSGSFYTPRPIVNFMVNEAIKNYLKNNFSDITDEQMNLLFNDNITEVKLDNNSKVIKKLLNIKVLDPACGSGAFPVGVLQQLVNIIKKLDSTYSTKQNLYELKLHLIENCIFGSDIQTIAVQIAKLRFFITLICEQEKNTDVEKNYGFEPLPNLETKFVSANSLIGLKKEQSLAMGMKNEQLNKLKNELLQIRTNHFNASTAFEKKKYRNEDKEKRAEIISLLEKQIVGVNTKLLSVLENEIKSYKEKIEKLPVVMIDAHEEQDLFDTAPKTLFQIDKNENKRKDLQKKLKIVQKKFEEEKSTKYSNDAEIQPLEELVSWNPYDQNAISSFFDPNWMFGIENGFDIVIGNPPYISTKGVTNEDKKAYEEEFGFSDDTYNLFTFKGIELTKEKGTLTYIIPKTFWTTQTKRNMRDLILEKNIKYIFDTANPFEAVMVDTCIIQIENSKYESTNKIRFLDGCKDLKNPVEFTPIKQETYIKTQNSVIFKPTEQNLKIWKLYGEKVKNLYNTWWEKIETSKKISQNEELLKEYRENLKPGDIALLGCLTEGGQGLATANNGKYIAVRKSTKWAANIIASRPKKLAEAIKENKKLAKELGDIDTVQYLSKKSEKQIAELFDSIKEKYGRDIFGQGYIYKLIDDSELADVDKLTDDEKENGISPKKKIYVPYDKGDKDGNRWYLETPFAIAWSKENVQFLKTNSGKKGAGMPVVRNPQFNFKEGFCWNLINGTRSENDLKFKYAKPCVNDVGSMTLHSYCNLISTKFIVCIGNSDFASRYTESYVNFTVNFQVNDCRQIPILIPTSEELELFNKLFDEAYEIKQQQFSNSINIDKAEKELNDIQIRLNKMVNLLYNLEI